LANDKLPGKKKQKKKGKKPRKKDFGDSIKHIVEML